MSQNEKNLSIRQDENKTDENIVSENDSCHDVEVSDTYLTWTDTFVMKKFVFASYFWSIFYIIFDI